MKIVLPEYIDILPKKCIEEVKRLGDVTVYKDFPKTEEEIIRRIKEAELIGIKWLILTDNIIKNAPNLKYIITLSSGYNQLPLKAAKNLGIKLINCPTHNTTAVAEHALALMLGLVRRIVEAQISMRKGRWKSSPYSYLGTELAGKKLLIIGYGRIGRQIAKRSKGLEMKVKFANSKTSPKDLDNLIKNSDIISLNLLLTKKTYHLIDERRIKLMRESTYLVNTSRGEIVDQKALLQALKTKRIAGAALDVFEEEPKTEKISEEIVELASLPNVIATPHIAYNTKEAALRLGNEFVENVKACINGKSVNVVD